MAAMALIFMLHQVAVGAHRRMAGRHLGQVLLEMVVREQHLVFLAAASLMAAAAAAAAEIPARVQAEQVVVVMVAGLIQALVDHLELQIEEAAVAVQLIHQLHPAQAALALSLFAIQIRFL